jgi:hypothetical protein
MKIIRVSFLRKSDTRTYIQYSRNLTFHDWYVRTLENCSLRNPSEFLLNDATYDDVDISREDLPFPGRRGSRQQALATST